MDHIGDFRIDDYLLLGVALSRFSSGAAYAPTGDVSYTIYENNTVNGPSGSTASASTLSQLNSKVGLYTGRVQLTAAAGYEAGKDYIVHYEVTVDSVAAHAVEWFRVIGNQKVDVDTIKTCSVTASNTVTFQNGSVAVVGDCQTGAQAALVANNLDHFMKQPVSDITKLGDGGGNEVPDSTVLSLLLCKGTDTDTFQHTTDSLEAIRDKLPTNLEDLSVTDTTGLVTVGAGTISTVTGAVVSVTAPVTVASGTITTVTGAVASVTAPVTVASGTITTVTGAVGSVTTPVVTASGTITTVATVTNAVTVVSGTVSTVTGAVGSVTTPVVTASGTISTVTGAVTVESGTVSTVTGAVGSVTTPVVVASGTLTTVTGAVGSVTTPAVVASGTITTVTGAVGSVTTPVVTASGTISTVTGGVNVTKINSATLTGDGSASTPWGPA